MYHHYDRQILSVESALTGNFCCTHRLLWKWAVQNICSLENCSTLQLSRTPWFWTLPFFVSIIPTKIQNVSKVPLPRWPISRTILLLSPSHVHCPLLAICSWKESGHLQICAFARHRIRRALHNASCTWHGKGDSALLGLGRLVLSGVWLWLGAALGLCDSPHPPLVGHFGCMWKQPFAPDLTLAAWLCGFWRKQRISAPSSWSSGL